MRRENGAALTETFVLMLALTPIMLGIPMIGKLIDLRQTTAQASRYGAWEATVSGGPKNVKGRFFQDSSKSLDAEASAKNVLWGDSENEQNATPATANQRQAADSFWGAQHTQVRINEDTAGALPYTSAYDSGADGAVTLRMQKMIEKAGSATAELTNGQWMNSGSLKGMLRSDVQAQVQANSWFEPLTSTDATVIMYDNWASGVYDDDRSERQAEERSRAMVPAGALESTANVFAAFGNFPLFKELLDIEDTFGRVDMNPLPAAEKRRRVLQPYTEN